MISLFNQDGEIKSYICRPWYPSKQISPVVPRLSVIDSEFVGDISLDDLEGCYSVSVTSSYIKLTETELEEENE